MAKVPQKSIYINGFSFIYLINFTFSLLLLRTFIPAIPEVRLPEQIIPFTALLFTPFLAIIFTPLYVLLAQKFFLFRNISYKLIRFFEIAGVIIMFVYIAVLAYFVYSFVSYVSYPGPTSI